MQKPLNVIPAKAGIQSVRAFLDPRFREGDGILEFCKSLKGKAGFAVKNIKILWLGLLVLGFLGCVCSVAQAMDEAQVERSFEQFQKDWIKKLNTEGKYGEKGMRVEKSPIDGSFTAKYEKVKEAAGSHIKKTGQAATPYVGTMHYEIYGCTAAGKTAEEARRGPFKCVLQTDTNEIFRFNGTKWLY